MKINDVLNEGKPGLWANIHAKRERIKRGSGERMRTPGSKGAPSDQDFKDAAKTDEAQNPAQQAAIAIAMKDKNKKPSNESEEYDDEAGMADNNLETLKRAVEGIDELIQPEENLPEWCQEKIAVAKSMLVTVWDYMKSEEDRNELEETYHGNEFYESPEIGDSVYLEFGDVLIETTITDLKKDGIVVHLDEIAKSMIISEKNKLDEAEYQGRKVSLGKPFLTPDGPKKRSVYVKNKKGNVVKVNFGQKGVRIKKNNPNRRKSFRARHNCSTAKDRTTPRYWSCKYW